jgi:hypothetical protein
LKTKQRMYTYLTVLFVLSIMGHFFSIAAMVMTNETLGVIFFMTSQVFELIMLLDTLLLLEVFEENKIFSSSLIGFTVLVSMIVGAFIAYPSVTTSEAVFGFFTQYLLVPGTFSTLLMLIFSIVSIAWLVRTYIRSKKTSQNPQQKKLVNLVFLGILLSQLVGNFAPIALEVGNTPDLQFIGRNLAIVTTVGMIIIGYAFYKVSNQPWLLQRQSVHLLLVYSNDGILLFSKAFRKDISDMDMNLLTGAITAMSAIFKESTKTETPIQAIMFEGKEVKLINRSSFICVLMVDYSTQSSEYAQQSFVKDFESKYSVQLASFKGEVTEFETAGILAKKYFA